MGRPLVDYVKTDDLPAVNVLVRGSSGAVRCRTLSTDPDTGGTSQVVDIPAGWTVPAARCSADVELMVLTGTLRVGGRRLLRLGYLFIPAGVAVPEVATDQAARLLVFTSAIAEAEPLGEPSGDWTGRCVGPLQLSDLAWEQPRTPGFPTGSARKTLRLDERTGDGFWVLGLLPHWDSAQREWHEFAEENFMLEGEIETAVGVMTPGAYLSHPPGRRYLHGPMRSRPGALVITRSSGPFATTYESAPDVHLPGPWP